MVGTKNIGTEIRKILYKSDKHALSAQDVADEIDDFSRQYIDRQLRSMAEGSGSIERIKIGPSVGYYWNHETLELLDSEFDGQSIVRATFRSPLPVQCMACERELVEEDEIVVIFETSGHEWHLVQHVCADHLEEERVDNFIQHFLPEQYLSDGLEDIGMTFVAVFGIVGEYEFTDRESGREMQTYILQDTAVLQYLRPREFSVGPEFPG